MDVFQLGTKDSSAPPGSLGTVKDEKWPESSVRAASFLRRDGVSVKAVRLCDSLSSKQRCIDANVSPLARRQVLTKALLRSFVQLEWLQHLAKIYSPVKTTGMSAEDGLLGMWEVVGSSPWGRVPLILLHYMLRVTGRENYGCSGTRVGGIGWS